MGAVDQPGNQVATTSVALAPLGVLRWAEQPVDTEGEARTLMNRRASASVCLGGEDRFGVAGGEGLAVVG
jgi:hypothetical protein